ncbi:MAG: helix-turn-helix domain-containing protein [Spirochaetes bacterium]|nr:helix-turn-helix domain-containing protein [Spirochaetota bacterium]
MEIGPYLRKIRRDKGYTITEVAQRLSLSVSLLSQIENGKVSPSLQSLEDILRFYAVNFSDFFRQVEQKRFVHVRKAESECLVNDAQGVTLTVLASKLQNNALESFVVELRPGGEIEVANLGPEVNGERMMFIISGHIEVALDGGEAVGMEEGDSLNFKCFVPCRIVNAHTEASRFIISGVPPVFL